MIEAGGNTHKPAPGVGRKIASLSELPDYMWSEEPVSDHSGIQFFTEVGMGRSKQSLMVDGGSALNSTTEEHVIALINENVDAGIRFGDKRHPIVALEKFPEDEALRGVAGSSPVPLLGSVVINVTMIEYVKNGKNTQD